MTAIQQAAELYAKHGMNLARDLENYMQFGFTFVTPDRLLLARPVNLNKGFDHWASLEESDAYYVKMAVGSGCMGWFLAQAPEPKPFLAWGSFLRNGKQDIKVFVTERVSRFINKKDFR